jgi:glycosyltransferase involved in cell wall biosynthesis
MRVAYVVSRFPHVSETFIVRELNAVSAADELEVELMSLFPAVAETVHPAAQPWVGRLRRGTFRGALAGLLWWLARRPLRLGSSAIAVVVAYARRPRVAVRALATIVIACQHARALAAHPVEHTHAHYATYPALAAWMCRRLTGVGYSFTAHAHDLYVDQSMLARKVEDARFVVTISEFNRDWLRPYVGQSGTPVEVVHCGIDPGEYRHRDRRLAEEGPIDALCVASLQEYKGHSVLLRAVAGDPRLGRISLDLVGEGELRRSLERLAAELGIADRVRFQGGLEEGEVRDRLAAADLFVLASVVAANGQMEGLPVALIEAMASELPVVATRLSGIPELVVDGETGLLADPGDPVSLAEVLAATLADPEGSRRRARAGREAVQQGFDVRETGSRMAALFERAVGPVSEPPARSRSASR